MRWSLYLAWVLALIGTLASFYYSEIMRIEPCPFCWYQRIALFPLAVQLGIAAYRSDVRFCLYAYPLCFIGISVALIQVLQPVFGVHLCGITSCKAPLVFHLIPLPWMSIVAFLAIGYLLRMAHRN